jgi:tellurite methyltransferase
MQPYTIQQLVGNTDIYLLDQIIKDRYGKNDRVLDAGCGNGRNLHWFIINHIECYGVDMAPFAIDQLKLQYPFLPDDRLQTTVVENLPFADEFFDHVVSSAVMHFANGFNQFTTMFTELARVLKPGGTLFIRMASNIGIENLVVSISAGVYNIPDGSTRFLLTKPLLEKLLKDHPFELIEPLKTVNVADIRCMTTLVLQKINNDRLTHSKI